MEYDFSTVIDRKGTGAVMNDTLIYFWHRRDLHPMWVADMDFAVCPDIIEAMQLRLNHPIFGYTIEPREYRTSIIDWVKTHHQWEIKREWISFIPGIVKGISFVCNVFLKPNEKVIVMPPVYHPFFLTPRANHHEVVWNPLKRGEDGQYRMDFENLLQAYDDQCRLLILSNPHNPGGVCWTREELIQLADFCYDHHVIVISDEIHCDMTLFGNKHIPFASVSEKAAEVSITFQAPTKTFNIAGIVSSYSIVPNEKLRKKFYDWLKATELDSAPIFSYIVSIAAFRKGEEWRRQMLKTVEENVIMVEDFFKARIPKIVPLRPQASFLVWLDCHALRMNHDELINFFVDKAHLALNDGEMFGPGGDGFMRMNIGAPKSYVAQGLRQLEEAWNKLKK